jgi:hypothetical protein
MMAYPCSSPEMRESRTWKSAGLSGRRESGDGGMTGMGQRMLEKGLYAKY